MSRPHIWMLHGPTASGKTALAIALANKLQANVLNCDARQIYQELNIGVARPSDEELAAAHHIGIASHSIHSPLTAMSFAQWARPIVQEELSRHGHLVIVGGSGLYAKALLYETDGLPAADPTVRTDLEARWNTDREALVQELVRRDPAYAAQVDLSNSRRVIRALEVITLSGQPYSAQRTMGREAKAHFDADLREIALWPPMEALTQRIQQRSGQMLAKGLRQEKQSTNGRVGRLSRILCPSGCG
ncbi:tRNA (adenosine(37)-N6)-dimethylallyltransferase MiaA [Schleiferiaceae bacterium]|nr:tRNA (adenosine(37)-N6)-dimethylallyltransferase MiaA [Schleiferiaceae bacterium]